MHDRYTPGEKVNISLAVRNEKNEAVAAALGVSVVDEALFALAGDRPTMTTPVLLASQMLKPEDLENADFYLSEEKTSAVPPTVALDLLLGTQGWRRFVDQSKPQSAESGGIRATAPAAGASSTAAWGRLLCSTTWAAFARTTKTSLPLIMPTGARFFTRSLRSAFSGHGDCSS